MGSKLWNQWAIENWQWIKAQEAMGNTNGITKIKISYFDAWLFNGYDKRIKIIPGKKLIVIHTFERTMPK